MAGSFLDVRERQSTVGIGDIGDLIEPRNRIPHMLRVGQWLFPMAWKGVDAVGQVTLRDQLAVFLVGSPGSFGHVIVTFFWRAIGAARPGLSMSLVRPMVALFGEWCVRQVAEIHTTRRLEIGILC